MSMFSDVTGEAGSSAPATAPLRRYFEVLACVARADGVYGDRERILIEAAARACELSPASLEAVVSLADPSRQVDVECVLQEAARSSDVSTIAETLRDAYVLASIDEDVAPSEHYVLERYLAHAGYDDVSRSVLLQWARTAAEHHLDGLKLLAELGGVRQPCSP